MRNDIDNRVVTTLLSMVTSIKQAKASLAIHNLSSINSAIKCCIAIHSNPKLHSKTIFRIERVTSKRENRATVRGCS